MITVHISSELIGKMVYSVPERIWNHVANHVEVDFTPLEKKWARREAEEANVEMDRLIDLTWKERQSLRPGEAEARYWLRYWGLYRAGGSVFGGRWAAEAYKLAVEQLPPF